MSVVSVKSVGEYLAGSGGRVDSVRPAGGYQHEDY